MQTIKCKIWKNFTTSSHGFHTTRCAIASVLCLILTKKIAPFIHLSCRLALSQNGGIIYKPSLFMGRRRRVWNSFPCLPPTPSFTLLRALSLEECFAFHSSLRPFTTITFAVINFAAVHTDRCNCYARRRLHLLKPPTYSTGPFDILVST